MGTMESLPIAWVGTILMSLSDPETKMFPDKQKEVTAPNHRGDVITKITERKSGPKFCVSWQKRQKSIQIIETQKSEPLAERES